DATAWLKPRHRFLSRDTPERSNLRDLAAGKLRMRLRPGDANAHGLIDQIRQQHSRAGRIGIDVKADGLLTPRRLDLLERAPAPAEITLSRAFVVRDYQRYAGAPSSAETLVKRSFHAVAFVAHVSRVDGTCAGQILQQLGHFVGGRSAAR